MAFYMAALVFSPESSRTNGPKPWRVRSTETLQFMKKKKLEKRRKAEKTFVKKSVT